MFEYSLTVDYDFFSKEKMKNIFSKQQISIPTDFSSKTKGGADGLVIATFP
jgi:hypothetical protein